jgi:anti-anti-sigma factor
MGAAMHIEKQTAGDVVVLAFTGEFDAAHEPQLVKEIDGMIEDATQVVFNVEGLTFINSSGLGYLLKTVKTLRDAGGDLVFSQPSRPFRNIVEVYGVAAVFHVCETDQAALEHFRKGC